MARCIGCGNLVDGDATVCSTCSKPKVEPSSHLPPARAATREPQRVVCPACKVDNFAGRQRCKMCRSELPPGSDFERRLHKTAGEVSRVLDPIMWFVAVPAAGWLIAGGWGIVGGLVAGIFGRAATRKD